MRKLKPNERMIKEYERFILIEVQCPHGESYKTTIDKWEPKDTTPLIKQNQSTYYYLGYTKRGLYHEF